MDIIKVNNLNFKYDDKYIFKDFNLNIKKGSWTCISGANKCGKTTLVRLLTGILKSDGINICNMDLNELNMYKIRKNIGVVFDDIDNYFLCESVIEEMAFTLENLNYDTEKINKKIINMSKKFNITQLLKKNPNNLSGGEKCKIAIICALIYNPKILILDDTLSFIDNDDKKEILLLLKELNKRGLTILLFTNDLSLSYYSDRLIILNNGIVLDDKPLKVMESDKILNRIGIVLPKEIELSMKLKLYGLMNSLEYDIESIAGELWD